MLRHQRLDELHRAAGVVRLAIRTVRGVVRIVLGCRDTDSGSCRGTVAVRRSRRRRYWHRRPSTSHRRRPGSRASSPAGSAGRRDGSKRSRNSSPEPMMTSRSSTARVSSRRPHSACRAPARGSTSPRAATGRVVVIFGLLVPGIEHGAREAAQRERGELPASIAVMRAWGGAVFSLRKMRSQ